MTEWVDKVEHQLESIRLSQKDEAEAVVLDCGVYVVKTQILQEVDIEIDALETRLMV